MKHFNELFHKNIIQKVTIYGSVITLTGTDGTADITINDIPNKVSATFLTDLTTTAHNWVVANIEHYEYHGYSISDSLGVISVTPKSDWDTVNRINATISNLTEDLSGTLTGVLEPDFSKADIWEATFTMNSTIANPRNPRDGDKMDLILVGTGSYTLSWGDAWVSNNSVTTIDTDIVTIKVRQVDGLSYAKSSFSWSSFWTSLISATVEDAEPTKIILTFPSAQTSLVTSDFSLSDRSISSISWDGAILTLNLYTAVVYGDSIIITFNKTGQIANLTNNILPWYLASGLSSLDVVGAWKSCGVADQATSYVNQANPGTNDLTATGAVTWNKTTGWGSFDRTRYLTGPVYKTQTYSVVVLVKNVNPTTASYGRAFSAEYDNGVHGTYIIPNSTNLADGGAIMNGNDYVLIDDSPNSVLGLNQSNGFVDGLDVGEISPSGDEYEIAIRIGFAAFVGATGQSLTGNVLAVAIYNKSISSDQMIAIQNKMKANEFIVGNLRSFTGLTRYASNPIIIHNTNEWNTVGSDTPFFNSISKIGSTYYALTQAATDYEAWNNILLYTSTDLVNWTLHANNPAIKNEASAWDDHYLIHPCIIKIADTWYAYYSAANMAGLHTVGCATSNDLITWTKHPSNPIYTPPAGRASVPFVILIGSTYFMYYWNRSNANVIKYATSPDGLTWTYGGDAVTSIESDWDYGYHLLDVWIVQNSNGLYEMVYTEYHGESGLIVQHIGYAVSWNGTKWYKKTEAILSKNGSGWEQGYVGDPVLFINDDGSANLYYAGMNDDDATANSDGGLAIIPK